MKITVQTSNKVVTVHCDEDIIEIFIGNDVQLTNEVEDDEPEDNEPEVDEPEVDEIAGAPAITFEQKKPLTIDEIVDVLETRGPYHIATPRNTDGIVAKSLLDDSDEKDDEKDTPQTLSFNRFMDECGREIPFLKQDWKEAQEKQVSWKAFRTSIRKKLFEIEPLLHPRLGEKYYWSEGCGFKYNAFTQKWWYFVPSPKLSKL
jgi:hypothetical protein